MPRSRTVRQDGTSNIFDRIGPQINQRAEDMEARLEQRRAARRERERLEQQLIDTARSMASAGVPSQENLTRIDTAMAETDQTAGPSITYAEGERNSFLSMYRDHDLQRYELDLFRRLIRNGILTSDNAWNTRLVQETRLADAQRYRQYIGLEARSPMDLNDIEFFALYLNPNLFARQMQDWGIQAGWSASTTEAWNDNNRARMNAIKQLRRDRGVPWSLGFISPMVMNDEMFMVWIAGCTERAFNVGVEEAYQDSGLRTTRAAIAHSFQERVEAMTGGNQSIMPSVVQNAVAPTTRELFFDEVTRPRTRSERTTDVPLVTAQRTRTLSGTEEMRRKAMRHIVLEQSVMYCVVEVQETARRNNYSFNYERMRCSCSAGRNGEPCSHGFRALLERAKESTGANVIIVFDSGLQMAGQEVGEGYTEHGFHWREIYHEEEGNGAIYSWDEYTAAHPRDTVSSGADRE